MSPEETLGDANDARSTSSDVLSATNDADTKIVLQEGSTGNFVEASLVERIDAPYAKAVDDSWLTYLGAAKANASAAKEAFPQVEHAHWSWHEKVKATAHLLPTPTMALEVGGEVQGLILIDTDRRIARLPAQKGMPVVYVDYLATAPWNFKPIAKNAKYRGVGTVLLRAAIQTSRDLGFKGRIALHSLPQSEAWYEKLKMEAVGIDPAKHHLKYYEMTPDQANVFME